MCEHYLFYPKHSKNPHCQVTKNKVNCYMLEGGACRGLDIITNTKIILRKLAIGDKFSFLSAHDVA